jgi:hypothetical protein
VRREVCANRTPRARGLVNWHGSEKSNTFSGMGRHILAKHVG